MSTTPTRSYCSSSPGRPCCAVRTAHSSCRPARWSHSLEGQAGAHSLVNHSDARVRYLVLSTTNRPGVVEYPDTGATLVVLAEQRLAYPHGAGAHQKPVIAEAMRAAADRDI
jgi:hypothetical protein